MTERPDRGRIDVHGMVALILAVGATISVCALAIGAVLQDSVISPQGSALLTTALGTLLGAVSVYLGGQLTTGRAKREKRSERRARLAAATNRDEKPDSLGSEDPG